MTYWPLNSYQFSVLIAYLIKKVELGHCFPLTFVGT